MRIRKYKNREKNREDVCPDAGCPPGNIQAACFLQMAVKMTRYAVHHDRRHVALDERAYIIYKFICNIRAVLCYPVAGNKLLVIGNLMHILNFCSTLVRVVGQTFEHNHLSGIPFVRSFHSRAAYLVSFQNINTGRAVGSGTLQRTELNGAGLAADLAGNKAGQIICRTGKLFVTEGIYKVNALSQFADIPSVF